jgi:hypothetical protein
MYLKKTQNPSIELSRRISFVSIFPSNPKMPRPKSLREIVSLLQKWKPKNSKEVRQVRSVNSTSSADAKTDCNSATP